MTAIQNNISFKARLNGDTSYSAYRDNKFVNGKKPDKFILERLNPEKGSIVMDLGAGQGRNSIPIAKMGYDVFSYEISPLGRNCIMQKANKAKVGNKITIIDKNLLDEIKNPEKADFAFMSHISQHFNADELAKVLKNVAQNLKQGSEFIFDALIRTKKEYKKYDAVPAIFPKGAYEGVYDSLETFGAASFEKTKILEAIKNAGFTLVQETPVSDSPFKKTGFERQNLWGGFKISDTFFDIPRKPVKLMWFVLKK